MIAVFGDSFVYPFTLVKMPGLSVYKFKGATARGISKSDNVNRMEIERVLGSAAMRGCSVFCFGSVDVHFSFYKKTWVMGERFRPEEIVKSYVAFVAGAIAGSKCVIGAYPSSVRDDSVVEQLVAYGVLTRSEASSLSKAKIRKSASLAARTARLRRFNRLLEDSCAEAGIGFVNPEPHLTDEKGRLLDRYRDPSPVCVHVLFEPLVPWLLGEIARVVGPCEMPLEFKKDLRQTLAKYLAEKRGIVRKYKALRDR
jgi:hypothetical protein